MNWFSEDQEKSVSAESTKIGQSFQELAIILGKRAKTITKQKAIETGKI
jgi:hypothetical protein